MRFLLFLFLLTLAAIFNTRAQEARMEQGAIIPLEPAKSEALFRCHFEPMPQFPGGEAALLRYLRDKLVYPDSAAYYTVQGTVNVRFVVGSDGKISDVTVVKPLGFGLDTEAIRLVRNMPNWETHGRTAVFYLPVRFYPE